MRSITAVVCALFLAESSSTCGYPKGNHDVLRHLTSETLRSARWQVPQAIYPDRQRLVGYDEGGRWSLEPKEPRFRGRITFTGMRVIKHDGSQHHLLGIQPDVPIEPTIAGIRSGRDEVLEKALEVIKKQARPER